MMLKFFFWALLLANTGLFAYQQGHLDTMLVSGHEPSRMNNQLNADKIKLIPAPVAKPPKAPVPEPAPEPAPVAAAPVVEKKAERFVCVELGRFNPSDAKRFMARLAPLSLGARVSQRSLQEVASHIVYIPPQGDREGAEKKVIELRQLGVEDFFVIQDNPALRWGISLGVFKQEEAARAHMENLTLQGVRGARLGQRMTASNMVAFQLRELDPATKNAVEKIKADFPKQEMRSCGPT